METEDKIDMHKRTKSMPKRTRRSRQVSGAKKEEETDIKNKQLAEGLRLIRQLSPIKMSK